MYGIALSVDACLRAGTQVHVAWLVDARGLPVGDRTDALAITPGGGRVGSLLSGALDASLADEARTVKRAGRLVTAEVSEAEALVAGWPEGGEARCLLVPADQLPPGLWPLLLEREPVGLVTQLEGDEVTGTTVLTADEATDADEPVAAAFAGRSSDVVVAGDLVVTVLWPVPQLVVVGSGPVAEALGQAAALVGWRTQVAGEVAMATGLIAGLAGIDKVVVASHDLEVAGPALAAALASDVGYIGALGSRRMQQSRAEWLAFRGVTDLGRVHGPAGFDIGAESPPEIAVAILAEALAVGRGRLPRTLDA